MAVNAKLTLLLAAVILPITAGRIDWRGITPKVKSQVRTLHIADAQALLSSFCKDSVKPIAGIGLTCATSRPGPRFSDLVGDRFHPEGVIFGHFTGPESDDAAVSGWSFESHPELWGGTLYCSRDATAIGAALVQKRCHH